MREDLPVNEKGIAVARDVLSRLDSIDLVMSHYMKADLKEEWANDDLQQHADELESCQVCLLGACLLSKARLFNSTAIRDLFLRDRDGSYVRDRSRLVDALSEAIPAEEQDLLETAFMCSPYGVGESIDIRRRAAADFGKRRNDPGNLAQRAKRARDVLNNFIEHGGHFMPEDDPLLQET